LSVELCIRVDEYLRRCRARGWVLQSQQAQAIGVAASTINRVVTGRQRPGGHFVGAVLRAFPDADFTDLFDLCD
jgi:hypothetical protein